MVDHASPTACHKEEMAVLCGKHAPKPRHASFLRIGNFSFEIKALAEHGGPCAQSYPQNMCKRWRRFGRRLKQWSAKQLPVNYSPENIRLKSSRCMADPVLAHNLIHTKCAEENQAAGRPRLSFNASLSTPATFVCGIGEIGTQTLHCLVFAQHYFSYKNQIPGALQSG